MYESNLSSWSTQYDSSLVTVTTTRQHCHFTVLFIRHSPSWRWYTWVSWLFSWWTCGFCARGSPPSFPLCLLSLRGTLGGWRGTFVRCGASRLVNELVRSFGAHPFLYLLLPWRHQISSIGLSHCSVSPLNSRNHLLGWVALLNQWFNFAHFEVFASSSKTSQSCFETVASWVMHGLLFLPLSSQFSFNLPIWRSCWARQSCVFSQLIRLFFPYFKPGAASSRYSYHRVYCV